MNKKQKVLLEYLLKEFKITKDELEIYRDFYNQNFENYDNTIYEKTETRLAHLLNYFEKDNWFNQRFKEYKKILLKHSNSNIVEIGYGLPYMQIENINTSNFNFIYVDSFISAEIISKKILKVLEKNAHLITSNLNSNLFKLIQKKQNPNLTTYLIAIETLEHLEHPQNFWKLGHELKPEKIVITLPIGPKIPSHHSYFENKEKAIKYVEQNMNIISTQNLSPQNISNRELDKYSVQTFVGNM